ncbi:MAG: CPBP family intramembrane metalloprotease [Tissierellia bacterium]|nr:CPBP family intramembrane metalloprotease [Tissierellia bacterium]
MDNQQDLDQIQEIVLEPLEDMIQTEEDLRNYRQKLLAEQSWNGRRISIGQANWLMILQAVAFVMVSYGISQRPSYEITLINQLLVVLLPGLLLVWLSRRSMVKTYRLNPLPIRVVTLIIGMTISIYPLGVLINAIVLMGLGQFMELAAPTVLAETGLGAYLQAILLVCIIPAICEEMMFRGIMLNAYEEDGKRYAIWATALLFGIFHFSLQNLIGPFLLGALLGFLTMKTGSIYAAMIAHFVHNFISNTIIHGMRLVHLVDTAEKRLPNVEQIATQDLAIAFGAVGLFVILGLFIFIRLAQKLVEVQRQQELMPKPLESQEAKIRKNQEFLPPGKDNIFEQTPIWLLVLMYVIINVVRIVYAK